MIPDGERLTPRWLALREPADAAARATDLADVLGAHVPAAGRWVIHDLGCGTGSMGRWLAPRLVGAQHWVLHDRDPDLLAVAARLTPAASADGAVVTVEPRASDIGALDAGALVGASLITTSAVLDLLTAAELERLVHVCAMARCPVLLTLSVVGDVALAPGDHLDARVGAAFNAHQRRQTGRGRLLGPDAVAAAVEAFGRLGAPAVVRPSPWRLGSADAALTSEWLTGWIAAAIEHEPALLAGTNGYVARRRSAARVGRLAASVGHADVLVLPPGRNGHG